MARRDTFERLFERGSPCAPDYGGVCERRLCHSFRARRVYSELPTSGATIRCRGLERFAPVKGFSSSRASHCTSSTPVTATWTGTGAAPERCRSRSIRTMRARGASGLAISYVCGTAAARCAPCARCPTACGRAWPGCPLAGSRTRAARASVNLLTPEEPTDWWWQWPLYAFVESPRATRTRWPPLDIRQAYAASPT